MNSAWPAAATDALFGGDVLLELVGLPRLEVLGVHGDDFHAHVGVRQATELGALTGVDARLVGFDAVRLHTAGDHVALAVQLRDPPRVDDVAAGATNEHRRADRDDHLAGGDDDVGDAAAAVLHGIVDFPPPLLTGDVDDALGVARLVERHHGADRGDRDAEQDQRRQDRQGDLEGRLAVRLLGDRLPAVAVAPHDEADGGEHDQTDDTGDDEHRVLEVLDLLGVRVRRAATCPAGHPSRSRRGSSQPARAARGRHDGSLIGLGGSLG